MSGFSSDVRLAMRRMAKNPGFALAVAGVLALGIGSAASIFTVVEAVLLRPLPYPDPARLLVVWETQPGLGKASISAPDLRDWRAEVKALDFAAFTGAGLNLTGRDQPERLASTLTDDSFFRVLRARAALGRTYGPGARGEVVLSDAAFRRLFAGDPGIIGKQITLDGQSHEVVGVLPAGFSYPNLTEAWMAAPEAIPLPPGAPKSLLDQRGSHYLRAIARLAPGASLEQARAQLAALGERLEAAWPDNNKGHRAGVGLLQDEVVGRVTGQLFALLAGVGLVLLIACANVAGLQLAQVAARQREVATRLALGATRFQLVRQLLTESVLLSCAGALLGLVLARWGVDALVALAGKGLPRGQEVHLDAGVLAFIAGVALASGLLSGLAPAVLASRQSSLAGLKDGSAAGFGRARVRSALVVAEVALALVLLAGAGLLVRSFLALRGADPGFEPAGALTLRISRTNVPEESLAPFYAELLRRVATLPGVSAAGAVKYLPFAGSNENSDMSIEGRARGPGERFLIEVQGVEGDYFSAMGIKLLQGRLLGPQDGPKAAPVALVNQAMASRYWAGQDAVGKRFSRDSDGKPPWILVVGVVGDVRPDLGEAPLPEAYFPLAQDPARFVTIIVRGAGDPGALSSGLRREIAALDPNLPVFGLQPLEQVVAASLAVRRASALLLAAFSALALLLAALGVYAMMAYAVVQRTREIGVRRALGAEEKTVTAMVIRQGMKLALLGVAIGAPLSLLLSRLLASQLYGVAPADALTHASVAALLALTALLACWLPARRAARVSPLVALRSE